MGSTRSDETSTHGQDHMCRQRDRCAETPTASRQANSGRLAPCRPTGRRRIHSPTAGPPFSHPAQISHRHASRQTRWPSTTSTDSLTTDNADGSPATGRSAAHRRTSGTIKRADRVKPRAHESLQPSQGGSCQSDLPAEPKAQRVTPHRTAPGTTVAGGAVLQLRDRDGYFVPGIGCKRVGRA